ncbi:hypothetical protein K438DRAFT_1792965 [Mycena galopus ATCC 62051]|nr:hypothetical protein K438DRAFT_1792965 [Mycena galopus ATCC 62051]
MRPHIEPYTDALDRGWRAERDYWQRVCNEFHARISWRLADHEEPELPLPIYDALAPPVVEDLTEEERVERHARREELNDRIWRWLKYRAQSLRRKVTKTALADSPYAALLSKLSGLKTPPKARQAYQQFMHEKVAEIAAIVDIRWKEKSINADGSANTGKPKAPFRSAVAREMFEELPSSKRDAYAKRATEEARAAKEAYTKALEAGPSKSPEARQRCIDNFGKFIAPIMKGIFDYTGLHGHIVLGGPMPRYNGELGTIQCVLFYSSMLNPY